MSQHTFLGFKQLYQRHGAGRSEKAYRLYLWREVRAGRFPAPLVVGPHSRAWRSDDIEAWEKALRPVTYAPHSTTDPAA